MRQSYLFLEMFMISDSSTILTLKFWDMSVAHLSCNHIQYNRKEECTFVYHRFPLRLWKTYHEIY